MNLRNSENWRSWMSNIKFLIGFILLWNTIPVKAQDVISLDSIINIIEKENPDLKFFDQKILSQDAKVAGAKSWMAPMIGAGTFMTPYPGQNTMNNGDKGALMIVAEQSLPSPAKIKSKQSYLASLSNITKDQKALTLNNLKALAKENYYDVIINKKKLKLLNENLHILSNLKKLAEIRYEYNKGTLSQIYKAESSIYGIHNQVEDADGNIKVAKINLNILMNRDPENPLHISDETFISSKILAIDSNYLLNNTSELKLAANEIKSMERESASIMNEAKPEFKIRFDHMSPLSDMMPQQYSAMAMVSIPIAPWSSKSYKADLKANKLEIQALEQRKNALLANNYGMIKSLQQKISNMEHHIEMFENKIIPVNKKNLDVLLLNYQENKEELPMVIEGWEMLNKAQLDHLNELGNYYKMVIEYEKSIEQ
jgi:cobalt-zinc-cadmium efflux system outer membrane protein